MNDHAEIMTDTATEIPSDFLFDKEHPILPVPFTARFGDGKYYGTGMSLTAFYLKVPGGAVEVGSEHIVKLEFNFEGFTIDLFPEVRISGVQGEDVVMQFIDPAGAHLPQLRYILNSFIAGDFVSLGSMLSYTGPAKPKAAKSDIGAGNVGVRSIRRIGAIALSVVLIAAAGATIWERYTTSYEPRPVFVARSGNDMRATSAGQISFINPDAKEGDVLYAISANTGDTLNFMLPCDCEFGLKDGIYKGATVLPSDPILTIFDNNTDVRVQSQMSIEGLTKAVNGEQVYLDLSDGRSVPVQVIQTSATTEAALRGDLYMPVVLKAEPGALGADDIGKPARVRLTKQLFGGFI
ncbi:hypothetical protein [Oceaniglobus ichthyenteri]|uniref:hypothetical protein n=1 Tax=Oceaniglobus ichthyenteri TaxID=2136177 RepID=UPI000D364E2B|nr:hypothetical protein [Oceaniglobus ichthyenteri]